MDRIEYVPFALAINRDEIFAKWGNRNALPIVYRHYINSLLIYRNETDDLSNMCKDIVATFDTRALEVERQRR